MLKSLRKISTGTCGNLGTSSSSGNTSVTTPTSQMPPITHRVIARHNYIPVNVETDLPLRKGDEYDIVDSSGVWWMARNKYGQVGLIPYNYVDTISTLPQPTTTTTANNHKPSHGIGNAPFATPTITSNSSPSPLSSLSSSSTLSSTSSSLSSTPPPPAPSTGQAVSLSRHHSMHNSYRPHIPHLKSPFSHHHHQVPAPPPPPLPSHNPIIGTKLCTSSSSCQLESSPMTSYLLEPNPIRNLWYFPNVDREIAESLLRKMNRDGTFLIRPSTTENKCYTLSLLFKNDKYAEVKHYLIQQCISTGVFYMRPQESFVSLDKLIKHYRLNKGHLITKLSQSPSRSNSIDLLSDPAKLIGLSKDKSWEIKASELQLLEELGSGQFGVVRHGKWNSKVDVAVKLMKEGTMSEQDFIEEAKVMTKLQHSNLVKLYGLCVEHRPICIVAEFMKHGSLLSFLRKNEQKLSESSHKTYILLNMCHQVCSGMAYLESHNYIHRDLAARNCLVGNNGIVKVADFGLTRYVIDDEYTSSGGTKFPIRWAPPEVLWYTRFSSKSDVWAYGILMWEVFSCGKLPYGKLSNAEVVEKIREGYRLDKPKNCNTEIFSLMQFCWQELAEKRPSFLKIESYLIGLKNHEIALRH